MVSPCRTNQEPYEQVAMLEELRKAQGDAAKARAAQAAAEAEVGRCKL